MTASRLSLIHCDSASGTGSGQCQWQWPVRGGGVTGVGCLVKRTNHTNCDLTHAKHPIEFSLITSSFFVPKGGRRDIAVETSRREFNAENFTSDRRVPCFVLIGERHLTANCMTGMGRTKKRILSGWKCVGLSSSASNNTIIILIQGNFY